MTIPTTTPGTLPHVHLKLRHAIAALAITAALLGAMRPATADASSTATSSKRGTMTLGDLHVRSTEDASGTFGNGDELYIRADSGSLSFTNDDARYRLFYE
jgi:hypothetical protein